MNPEELQKLPAALFEIGKLIGSELDPGILLSRIAQLICQLIDAEACSVMLIDADRKRLPGGDHHSHTPIAAGASVADGRPRLARRNVIVSPHAARFACACAGPSPPNAKVLL